jgi:outer membrane protein OmpA-like peptidoglycan-associated protein
MKANVIVGHAAEVTVSLSPREVKSKVLGRVTDETGKGIEATVKVSGTTDAETKADASGSFTLELPPGSYSARIETAKFAPRSESFELASGVDRSLDISFKGAAGAALGGRLGKLPRAAGAPSGPAPAAGGAALRGKRIVASRPVAFMVSGTTPSATLLAGSRAALDEVAELLAGRPQLKVRVEAHWDPSAGPDVEDVTKKQAEAVAAHLAKKGVAADRIQAIGMGAKKPLVPNIGAAARTKNRRVELHVVN